MMFEMKRVAVIGCIGAGKSTIARAIGVRLGVKVFHLDRLWWQPGEYKIVGAATVAAHTIEAEEFRRLEESIVAEESWIVDGGVANIDLRLARADTVVFLDLPRWLCTWQLLKRHNHPRLDYPEGVTEGLGWLWLLLRWIWRTWPTERRPGVVAAMEKQATDATVMRLRTRRQVRDFLDQIVAGPEGAPS